MIVRMYTGSKVYGTSLPTSDTDIKEVFQPTALDLVMMTAKTHYVKNTKNSPEKNSKDDIDLEGFCLARFLELVAEGQTIALDMLFTPPEFLLETSNVWQHVQRNKDKLLSKKATAFVRYCQKQAGKYQVKAERVDLLHEILGLLGGLPKKARLESIPQIVALSANGYIEVCNRKCLLTFTVEKAIEMYELALSSYGERSRAAAANKFDFKALYHAVRVAREAEELMLTGHITLPRPEADLLLKIRSRLMDYDEICALIEEGLIRVEEAVIKSQLPANPDMGFINGLIFEENLREIKSLYARR